MSSSILDTEIHEQPGVLQRLLHEARAPVRAAAARLRRLGVHHVVIAARGSSDNAARYAQYVFGVYNRLTVTLATPSIFTRYQAAPRMDGAAVAGISQSGESPDLIAVVEAGRRQGCPTLAITNVPGSPLAAAADETILLHAGQEKSVAATKTYTAQLLILALLSAALAEDEARDAELAAVPDLVGDVLTTAHAAVPPAVDLLRPADHAVVIGRGFNFATAYEVALKAKELAYVAAEPYSAADFQHGPIALVDTGFAAIVVNPTGAVSDEIDGLLDEMVRRGTRPVVISDHARSLDRAAAPIELPEGVPEWLSPIVAVVPGQMLAAELSRARGFDPDRPRGLRKVTRTT
jgi:glucosamine--fructose-6-phosphate aminotransferase (isomerizing)